VSGIGKAYLVKKRCRHCEVGKFSVVKLRIVCSDIRRASSEDSAPELRISAMQEHYHIALRW